MAAYKAGVKTVIIPKENERDIAEFDDVVKQNLNFVPVTSIAEVLSHALTRTNIARFEPVIAPLDVNAENAVLPHGTGTRPVA